MSEGMVVREAAQAMGPNMNNPCDIQYTPVEKIGELENTGRIQCRKGEGFSGGGGGIRPCPDPPAASVFFGGCQNCTKKT